MSTLKDIAKILKVDISTVSNALSGKGRVGEATKKRILKVAEELNYQPNTGARLLKNKSIIDVGLIIADNQGMFINTFLSYCKAYGLQSQIELVSNEKPHFPKLLAKGYSKGVLYVGGIIPEVKQFISDNPNYPLVTINEISPFCVHTDYYGTVFRIMQYFVAHKHKRIAMTLPEQRYDMNKQITKGIKDCCKTFDIDKSPELAPKAFKKKSYKQTMLDAAAWAEKLFSLKHPPTALLSSSMGHSHGIIYTALKMGIRIPEDFCLISVSAFAEGGACLPTISCFSPDNELIFSQAMLLLQNRISGTAIEKKDIKIEAKITFRDSLPNQEDF